MVRNTITRGITSAVAVALLLACSASLKAQSPTSLAENSSEYNAYVYSYIATVQSGGIANTMSGNTVESDVANLVDEFTTAGFLTAYECLLHGDDTLWNDVADELGMARFWCNTLIVYAEDSQSNTTIQNINNLMNTLDIAIDNAEAAAPSQKKIWWSAVMMRRF